MTRVAICLLVLTLNFSNYLSAQSTAEIIGTSSPSNFSFHSTSISTWNNEKIISGGSEFDRNCAFIRIDSARTFGNQKRLYYFDYPCDGVTSSTSLGTDLFTMAGTLSDTINGIYPRPYVVLVDTLNLPQFAITIPDTSLSFEIHPEIATTTDGGFILTWTSGNGEGRVVKFNHSGGFVWGHLFAISGVFNIDDLAVKNNGEIIVAGRNSLSQGLQPTLLTLDSNGQMIRAITILEQQSEKVSIAVSNNIAISFCTPDSLQTPYNKLNLLLLDQNDSILNGNSYSIPNSNYECADLSFYNDTTWLITGNIFIQGSPEIGFYLKGSTAIPLINDSYVGDNSLYTTFSSSLIDTDGTIFTAGNEGLFEMGLIVITGLPIDDCLHLAFNAVATSYNPNATTAPITGQIYSPILNDPHPVWGSNIFPYMYNCVSGVNENPNNNFEVNVFPNPVTTNATFQFKGSEGNRTLIVYDQLGKEIWRKETNENQIEFLTQDFSAGLYFYHVEQEGEIKATGKLVIQ